MWAKETKGFRSGVTTVSAKVEIPPGTVFGTRPRGSIGNDNGPGAVDIDETDPRIVEAERAMGGKIAPPPVPTWQERVDVTSPVKLALAQSRRAGRRAAVTLAKVPGVKRASELEAADGPGDGDTDPSERGGRAVLGGDVAAEKVAGGAAVGPFVETTGGSAVVLPGAVTAARPKRKPGMAKKAAGEAGGGKRPAHRPVEVGKPWEAMDPPMSRAAYYRRKAKGLL